MALINCPDCGKEISEHAKNCMHCGCPIKKPKKKLTKKTLIFLIVSVACLIVFIPFLFCGIFIGNGSPFYDLHYCNIAYNTLGNGEKRGYYNELFYYRRVGAECLAFDIYLESDRFELYLSDNEIIAKFYDGQLDKFINYVMVNNNLQIDNPSLYDEFSIKKADIMQKMNFTLLNISLEGKCEVEDILIEYNNYCIQVKATKIACYIFAGLTLACAIAFMILFLLLRKKSDKKLTDKEIINENDNQ